MSTNVYGHHCLESNWQEDRAQPQGRLSSDAALNNKFLRPPETDLAYIGDGYDVLGRISRVPQRESYATPNDGFNEKLQTSSVDFCHPKSRAEFSKSRESAPSLINTENAPVRPPEKRPLPGTRSGFGAHLNRHLDKHDVRSWSTTHGDFFGYDPSGSMRSRSFTNPASHHGAGVSTEHEENRTQGLRVGKLCGESFIESSDPATDSRTQRSWMHDVAYKNIHLGGTKPREKDGLEMGNSLPMGDGAMSKIRQDLKDRNGSLFRVATHITKGKGSRGGISIFQDE